MRDFMGNHVSKVNRHGHAVGGDGVAATASVWGSFRVHFAENVDRVCVAIEDEYPGRGRMSMQLTLEQAVLLRELLDAGIEDARTAQGVEIAAGVDEVAS
ncbi:hypothetical protein IU501_07260 [Nocardia otitidiscaviarum]|uniref:hypothetical protein n=1 Tax=Nocardia otitidiscaviarum TaxID=1823 RepID=UPI0018958E75|nr:hypothetical protein [Nocardia otitidiscaviarum]MBF6132800.1 hypothetical protein [Nocardia otitidiscaviarum]